MRYVERPLTKKQREELQGYVALSTQLLRAVLFVAFVGGLGILLRAAQKGVTISETPWWLIPTGTIAVALFVYSKRWTGGPDGRRKIREDLESGLARVTIIEPASVIEIEEVEDEGPSYIVETTDGETILFSGQYLTFLRRFPWSEFEIVETPRSKRFLGLKRSGDPIPVDETRPALSCGVMKKLGCLSEDYIVLDGEGKALLDSEASP